MRLCKLKKKIQLFNYSWNFALKHFLQQIFFFFFFPARYLGSLEGSINVFYYSSKEVPIRIVMLRNTASMQYMTNILICASLNCTLRFVAGTCTHTHLTAPRDPGVFHMEAPGKYGAIMTDNCYQTARAYRCTKKPLRAYVEYIMPERHAETSLVSSF